MRKRRSRNLADGVREVVSRTRAGFHEFLVGWQPSASSASSSAPKPEMRRTGTVVVGDVNNLQPELSSLRQFLAEDEPCNERFLDRTFGLSNNDKTNLHRLGIKNTTDKQLRNIMWRLVHNRQFTGDVASMLYDSRVKWCVFNIFTTDVDLDDKTHQQVFVIRAFSQFGLRLDDVMYYIAVWSLFYSTLIFFYWDAIGKFFLNAESATDDPWTLVLVFFRILDAVFTIIYFFGAIARFRMSIVNLVAATETVDRRKLTRITLNSKSFWCDCFTCIPWIELACNGLVMRPAQLAGCMRAWRFHRASLEAQLLVRDNVLSSIIRLLLCIWVLGHLIGCIVFWYGAAGILSRHSTMSGTCDGSMESISFSLLYFYTWKMGVYLALAIDIDGHSPTDNLFIALITPIGALINALLFSEIIVLMARLRTLETQHTERTDNIYQAMTSLALPSSVQLRIMAYYTYEKTHRSHATFSALFKGLNSQLHFELHLVMYYDLLTNTPFFKKAQPKLLRELILALKDIIFLPGDFVCRFGDEGQEMFFIHSGCCSVISENMTTELKQLRPGDYFGEISLLTNQKRTAYVRANTFCTLATLNKDSFDTIMYIYPKQLEVIVSLMSDLQKALIQNASKQLSRQPSRCPSFCINRANSRLMLESDVASPTDTKLEVRVTASMSQPSAVSSSSGSSGSEVSLSFEPSSAPQKLLATLTTAPNHTAVGTSVFPSENPSRAASRMQNKPDIPPRLDSSALQSKLSMLATETHSDEDEEPIRRVSPAPLISVQSPRVKDPQSPRRNSEAMLTELANLESEIGSRIQGILRGYYSIDNRIGDVQRQCESTRDEDEKDRAQCQAALEVISTLAEATRDEVIRLVAGDVDEEEDLVERAAGLVESQGNFTGNVIDSGEALL